MLIQAGGCAPAPLFQIRDAQVVRAGKTILHVGDFSLDEGEHVALLVPFVSRGAAGEVSRPGAPVA